MQTVVIQRERRFVPRPPPLALRALLAVTEKGTPNVCRTRRPSTDGLASLRKSAVILERWVHPPNGKSHVFGRLFLKPSDGLEPSVPSL